MAEPLRLGVFCPYENLTHDDRVTLQSEARLVVQAEALGFDEAWIAEHHFDENSSSPSVIPLLCHLAALTSRIRLGSAAVLLPFRSPIQVAEDVATLDLLSGGRFNFGVARGGPFPAQNLHFGITTEESRERMLDALTLIQRLLTEDCVQHQGRFYRADRIRLVPRPLQQPIPTWVATATDDALRHAAEHGYGVMVGLPAPLEMLQRTLGRYRSHNAAADPRPVVSRFYCGAVTREAAIAEAAPFIQGFAARKKKLFAAWGVETPPTFDVDALIGRSLIGSHAELREKVDALSAAGARSLLIVPASENFDRRGALLAEFREHVR